MGRGKLAGLLCNVYQPFKRHWGGCLSLLWLRRLCSDQDVWDDLRLPPAWPLAFSVWKCCRGSIYSSRSNEAPWGPGRTMWRRLSTRAIHYLGNVSFCSVFSRAPLILGCVLACGPGTALVITVNHHSDVHMDCGFLSGFHARAYPSPYTVVYTPPTVVLLHRSTTFLPLFSYPGNQTHKIFGHCVQLSLAVVVQQLSLHKQVNMSAPPAWPPAKHLHFAAVSTAQLLEPTVHLPFMNVINGRVTRWMIFRGNKQKETICAFLQQREGRSWITSSPRL